MHQVIEDEPGAGGPSIYVPDDLARCDVLVWPVFWDTGVEDVLAPLRGRGEVSLRELVMNSSIDDIDRVWFLTRWLAHLGGHRALARIVALLARAAAPAARMEVIENARGELGHLLLRDADLAVDDAVAAARAGYGAAWHDTFVMPLAMDLRERLMRRRPHDGGMPAIGLAQQALVQPMGPSNAWIAFCCAWELWGDAATALIVPRLSREIRAAWAG